jgi:hypothetical protein
LEEKVRLCRAGRTIGAVFPAALLAACTAKLVVIHVPDGVLPADKRPVPEGVFYALPRTVVKVDLPVDRIETRAGRYVEYTKLFFPQLAREAEARMESVRKVADPSALATDPVASFKLGTPTFSVVGEPDPGQVYFVKVTGGLAVDRTAVLEYTEQGAVQGAQLEEASVAAEVALGLVGAASGILTRTALTGASERTLAVNPPGSTARVCPQAPSAEMAERAKMDDPVWQFFKKYQMDPVVQAAEEAFARYCDLDAEKRRSIANAVHAVKPELVGAYGAFQRIYRLQSAREKVLTGQSLAPEVILRDLDAAIGRELAASFLGLEAKEQWVGAFEVRPATLADRPEIMQFSKAGGVCQTADLRGKLASPGKFTVAKKCDDRRPVVVGFRLDGQDQPLKRIAGQYMVGTDLERSGDRSFRYRVPALARIDVRWLATPETCVGEGGAAIGQFGEILSLPAKSGGRSLNYDLKFYEATGALKSFRLASKSAIQKGNVDTLSSSANAMLDAKLKKEQEEAKAADELNQLERRRKILEEQVKIRQACAALGIECTP